ncbi:MAG: site-specific DNA-methyltransferase, partial [Fimbriimonadaceae bacterium]|nr:site-specific DNA-methyltransferase [Fimbriimonadaceae bacterium]
YREHDFYEITLPSGRKVTPAQGRSWSVPKATFQALVEDQRIWFGPTGDSMPRRKRFLSEVKESITPTSFWGKECGDNAKATRDLNRIFSDRANTFSTPKPFDLIQKVILTCTDEHALILDSFAGSGTTGHAVLGTGPNNGGSRKFILVEMEDYADTLTAERVRRVINGYPYQGTQRETLYEKKLTWTEVRKGDALKQEALDAKALHEGDYDSIETKVEDGVLKVIGVRNVKEQALGLGGSFTYCELGRPIELDKLLSGGALPDREAVADYIIYLAGLDKNKLEHRKMPDDVKDTYLGTADGMHIWLLYRPDKKYLSSADSALTLEVARAINASDKQGRHRVYSPAKYVGTKRLRDEKIEIEHVPLPLALFRGHTE